MNNHQKTIAAIKKLLRQEADAIQKLATQQHKQFLKQKIFRSEFIEKYQRNHIEIVTKLATYLDRKKLPQGLAVFKKLGHRIAMDSLADDLSIEEAVDGIIFLKQAVWKKAAQAGLVTQLTSVEFYKISETVGTYIDVVASKIAFIYHERYRAQMQKDLAARQELERQKEEFMGMVE